MWGKILTMSMALVIVISFIACAEEAEKEAQLPSPQEIVDGVIEALQSIKTYQMDIDMTIDMSGEDNDEVFEASMVMDSSSALDLENEKMKMYITMNMAMPGEDQMKMAMDMYLISDMMYTMMDVPEMAPMWMKSEIPEGLWEQQNQVEAQVKLLKTAQVEVLGSEKVGGIDCYIFQITPDMKQLWQMAMQQTQITGGEMPDVAEELIQEMFQSFSMKHWIAKDTYFLTKTEAEMVLELTPEAMGSPEEEGVLTMDIALSLLAYNQNQPVSITLPPEAEEVIAAPMK